MQGFDSQGLNPFTYVLNRPTSATDPTGQYILNGFTVASTWRAEAANAAGSEWAIARDSKVLSGTQSGSAAAKGIGSQPTDGQVADIANPAVPGSIGDAAAGGVTGSAVAKFASF